MLVEVHVNVPTTSVENGKTTLANSLSAVDANGPSIVARYVVTNHFSL